jgi:hypothetical protein
MEMSRQLHAPAALSSGNPMVPLYERLGGPHRQYRLMEKKNLLPPAVNITNSGFPAVQPAAYTLRGTVLEW